jgi:hypothetical protein
MAKGAPAFAFIQFFSARNEFLCGGKRIDKGFGLVHVFWWNQRLKIPGASGPCGSAGECEQDNTYPDSNENFPTTGMHRVWLLL